MTEAFIFFGLGYVACLFQGYLWAWIKAGFAKLTGKLPPPPVV
jgi:hypothetical protein